MQAVPSFKRNRDYADLSIPATLDYMKAMYVDGMARRLTLGEAILCDCAAGFGWLSFAFLLAGGKHAVLVDPNHGKLDAAREFARILGVADRCEFRSDLLHELPLADRSIDIFASVETLEHVGKANIGPSVRNIERITRQMIILTAPNQVSPLVAHDAGLPFSHWLPLAWREPICGLLGRKGYEHNHFPTPWHLRPLSKRFATDTKALVFDNYRDWRNHYPVYSPYAGGRWKHTPALWLRLYLRLLSAVLHRRSYWISPNLAAIWVERDAKT